MADMVDPPWRFDPHTWIRRFRAAGYIGVLQFRAQWSANQPYVDDPSLLGLAFTSTEFGLNATVRYPGVAPFVDPISARMRATEYMWGRTPYFNQTADSRIESVQVVDIATWQWWIFGAGSPAYSQNIYYISGVPNYALINSISAVIADDFNVSINHVLSFPIVVVSSHNETQTITSYVSILNAMVFFNIPKIGKFITGNNPKFHLIVQTGPATGNQSYHWQTSVSLWKNKKAFPVDAQNIPTWSGAAFSLADTASPDVPEIAMPPASSTFVVDLKTFLVTATRTP